MNSQHEAEQASEIALYAGRFFLIAGIVAAAVMLVWGSDISRDPSDAPFAWCAVSIVSGVILNIVCRCIRAVILLLLDISRQTRR